ncbi:hypothetical protein Pfo_027375 [Paulownia fortunei]|nr:hypothetical protein Pfo_027375 [Paulownia fortunei]
MEIIYTYKQINKKNPIKKRNESKSEKNGGVEWPAQFQNFRRNNEPHNVSPSTVHPDWYNPTVHISPTPSYKPPHFNVSFGRLKTIRKTQPRVEPGRSLLFSPLSLSLSTPFVLSLEVCCFQKYRK